MVCARIDARHDIGIEHANKRVEIAFTRSEKEGVYHNEQAHQQPYRPRCLRRKKRDLSLQDAHYDEWIDEVSVFALSFKIASAVFRMVAGSAVQRANSFNAS